MKKKGKINRFILREKAAEETLGTRKWLTQTLLLFLCLAGYSGFFISLFELPALLPLWLGGCLVFSALAIFLKLLKKPRDLFLIAAWWLVMAAVVLVFREQLTEGRNLLLNAAVNRSRPIGNIHTHCRIQPSGCAGGEIDGSDPAIRQCFQTAADRAVNVGLPECQFRNSLVNDRYISFPRSLCDDIPVKVSASESNGGCV